MKERVLVTGGASGIGASIVDRCLQEGYEPVVIDRMGSGLKADLSDRESTAAALQQALADGPIHRLVNNVGMIKVASIESVSFEDLELTWSLNMGSAIQCLQAVLPAMKERGFGRVVNISSRVALGKEGRTAYASSKAALLGLTRTWALELGKHGITVNAIGPGPIRTALFDAANPPGEPSTRAIIDSVPMQRMGEPEDIANSVAHLLDDRTGFVTGQTLYVCGGKTVGTAGI